jgi:hypothetical protein
MLEPVPFFFQTTYSRHSHNFSRKEKNDESDPLLPLTLLQSFRRSYQNRRRRLEDT